MSSGLFRVLILVSLSTHIALKSCRFVPLPSRFFSTRGGEGTVSGTSLDDVISDVCSAASIVDGDLATIGHFRNIKIQLDSEA